MDAKTLLLAALVVVAIAFFVFWFFEVRKQGASGGVTTAGHLGIGFFTNFLDTLGISSFATTTTMYRFWRLVPDEHIPGTLNIGHAAPTFAQALIYITIVQVDIRTLIVLIVASVAGSWIGAAIVAQMPRRAIQRGMGVALLAAAGLMVMTALNLFPLGGEALGLSGARLTLAIGLNFVIGALMTIGIGAYAPIMIMVSLMGMNPTAAFPIMLGSCAFLMPVASARFVRERGFDLRASLGLLLGGIPAVLIAALIVKSLDLTIVRWLVLAVVLYTAIGLIRAARREDAAAPAPAPSRAAGAVTP